MTLHARRSTDLAFFGPRIPAAVSEKGGDARRVWAMVDTGARGSVIATTIAEELGLVSSGWRYVQTAARDERVPLFEIVIALDGGPSWNLRAAGMELPGHSVQVLLGRDALASGVLVYDGTRNQFMLAY